MGVCIGVIYGTRRDSLGTVLEAMMAENLVELWSDKWCTPATREADAMPVVFRSVHR